MIYHASLVVFFMIAVWLTLINSYKLLYKNRISGSNIFWQAVGIVGFVVVKWWGFF